MEPIIIKDIATDVELFIQNKETGELVSAEPYISGTKYDPWQFDQSSKYYATSLDNTLAEFSIPPATTVEQFFKSVAKARGYVESILPKGYCTVSLPAAEVGKQWLQSSNAMHSGCESDFNAYTGRENRPVRLYNTNVRAAGFHLHIGLSDPEEFKFDNGGLCTPKSLALVQALDLHLGVPSVLEEPTTRRRELYGKAGSFRLKPYGLEYRTLSGDIASSERKIRWAYSTAHMAAEWLSQGNIIEAQLAHLVRDCINTNDKATAAELVKAHNLITI